MFGEEVWDEDAWEAFLKQNDLHVERFMAALRTFLEEEPAPRPADGPAHREWRRRLERYLRRRGLEPEEPLLEYLLPGDAESAEHDAAAWLAQLGLGLDDEEREELRGEVLHLPLFRQSGEFAADVLDWVQALHDADRHSSLAQLCFLASQIPAFVARGHGLGFHRDTIGGNIACVRRALASANAGLALLSEMAAEPYMSPERYRRLAEALQELRGELGVYVIELRARSRLPFD